MGVTGRRRRTWGGAGATALLLAGASTAAAQATPQRPRDRVLDQAGVLSAADRDDLQRTIWALERDTGAEVGVLVGRTSSGQDPARFAEGVFNAWGIGKRGRDNGVLFMLLVRDRQVRITPGTGYRGLLDEEAAGRILDQDVVPLLKAGDPGAAVCAGVRRIAAVVRRHEGAAAEPGPGPVEAGGGFGGGARDASAQAPEPAPTPAAAPAPRTSSPPLSAPARTSRRGFNLFALVSGALGAGGAVCFWPVVIVAVIGLAILLRPKCPRCQTYLSTSSRTLVSATYTSSGRGERTLDCPKCRYHRVEVYTIPMRRHTTTHRTSYGSSSRSSFGSSFGSRSSGSSSRPSGGSSFGGGRSSGGGAGRSW